MVLSNDKRIKKRVFHSSILCYKERDAIRMAKYSVTEKRLMKKLGISDWRHLTKDRMVKFASSIKNVDPEVAKRILAQFPDFKDYSLSLLKEYSQNIDLIIEKNKSSSEEMVSVCKSLITTLESLIASDVTDLSEKDKLIDKELEVINLMREIDADNKRYLLLVNGMLGLVSAFSFAVVGSVLGSNVKLSDKSSPESEDNDECTNCLDDDNIEIFDEEE